MSKLSKVLSVLLAMVFVFSTMTIGVEAVSYKDSAITDYNAVGKPILSTDQYASMAMDELDRMLMEENFKLDIDIGGAIVIKKSFTTIDVSLDSIVSIYNDTLSPLLSTIGGDIQNLNFSALLDAPRRGTTGEQDADIFRALFQFLADNVDILKKLPYGSDPTNGINLGELLSKFVDLSEYVDLVPIIKTPVAQIVWPKTPKAELDLTKTLDEYVEILIDEVANGTYPDDSGIIKRASTLISRYLPGITDEIDMLNDSVYDIIAKGFKLVLNPVLVPLANNYIPVALKKFCGYAFTKTKDQDGDPLYLPDHDNDDINPVRTGVINVNFHLANFDVSGWSNRDIVDHVNDILGAIVKEAINPSIRGEVDWQNGDNSKLVDNIIRTAKVLLNHTGNDFFASYVEVKTPAELDQMSQDQFIAYILRSIVNGSIDEVYIDNSIDTMEGVLFELVRSLAGTAVPSQNYASMQPSVDNMIKIGLDIAAAGLNGITDMNLAYGMEPDAFAEACMNWVIENYAGFVSDIQGSGWAALSYVVMKVIPADWLPTRDGAERDNVYDILFTDIVENIINDDHEVKLDKILDLARRNDDGELNGTLISVLLKRIVSIVNYIIEDTFPDGYDYDTLEGLLDKEMLSEIIEGLINGLNNSVDRLMPSLLPVVCMALGLSSDESFGDPYVNLEDITTLNPSITTSFYMYNGSGGINTNARNKTTGKFPEEPDQLYKYKINSVSTNIPGLNITWSGGDWINGSTAKTFTFSDVDLTNPDYEGQLLVVTIDYDVYEEQGEKMTEDSLTATTYSVISTRTDDGSEQKRFNDATGNTSLVVKFKTATYISTETKLSDLADITIDVTRDYYKNNRLHRLAANFYVSKAQLMPGDNDSLADHGVTTNTNFNVATTYSGGKWAWKPYVVPAAHKNDTLEPGIYQMNFTVKTETGTQSSTNTGSVSSTHTIAVFDDHDLKKLVDRAVSANRQEANYADSGTFPANYISYENLGVEDAEAEEQPDVDASDAWFNYATALEAAATFVYAPRQVNNFGDPAYLDNYDLMANDLYTATQNLEACAQGGGVQGVQDAIDAIVVPDYTLDEDGNKVYAEYDDPACTYFAREDYLSYTYGNFKRERRAAQRLIDAVEEAAKKGETYVVNPVRAAYLAHRVTLYGDRLIRVVANKQHLAAAIQKYGNIAQGEYSDESYEEYTRALAFAQLVNGKPVGDYYNQPNADNYLFLKNQTSTTTLRQSMVNEARGQLIRAAKRLVVETTVNYSLLKTAIANAKATYDAGSTGWTAVSWATFKQAYDNGVSLVAQNLDKTDANQTLVDNAASAINDALAELVALTVNYTQLNTAIANAKATYDAGSAGWTAESWAPFAQAYQNGVTLVAQNLRLTDANQTLVNNAATTLNNMLAALVKEASGDDGALVFADNYGTMSVFESDINGYHYLSGLDPEDPCVDGYIDEGSLGGWTTEIEYNDMYAESTGAILHVYNAAGEEIVDGGFVIVLFGDVTGDSAINGEDAQEIYNYAMDPTMTIWGDFEEPDSTAYAMAADVNHDYSVDGQDGNFVLDHCAEIYGYHINQGWNYDNGEVYLYD